MFFFSVKQFYNNHNIFMLTYKGKKVNISYVTLNEKLLKLFPDKRKT